jgi:uncharacterized protein YdiU (UPF0061 family)
LPLLGSDTDTEIRIAETELAGFMPGFKAAFYRGLRDKLGLTNEPEVANAFVDETLALLGEHAIDMTVFFDTLTRVAGGEPDDALLELFGEPAVAQERLTSGLTPWLTRWNDLRSDGADTAQCMRRANPAVIARNHRVEEALQAATDRSDLEPFLRLTEALQNPFHCAPEHADLQIPPLPEERVTATFCGT